MLSCLNFQGIFRLLFSNGAKEKQQKIYEENYGKQEHLRKINIRLIFLNFFIFHTPYMENKNRLDLMEKYPFVVEKYFIFP